MTVKTYYISVSSKNDMDIIDITDNVQKELEKSGLNDGTVTIFVTGSTGSVSTIEYEPNLVKDVKEAMEIIAPSGKDYHHHKTWNDKNGKSHVRATLMGPSLTVPFGFGKLMLGTWQQIVFIDFDVPARERKLVVQIMGE